MSEIGKRKRYLVLRRDGSTCYMCKTGGDKDNPLQVDHIVPRSAGGSNDLSNLATCCRDCNAGKSALMFEDDPVPPVSMEYVQFRKHIDELAVVYKGRDRHKVLHPELARWVKQEIYGELSVSVEEDLHRWFGWHGRFAGVLVVDYFMNNGLDLLHVIDAIEAVEKKTGTHRCEDHSVFDPVEQAWSECTECVAQRRMACGLLWQDYRKVKAVAS